MQNFFDQFDPAPSAAPQVAPAFIPGTPKQMKPQEIAAEARAEAAAARADAAEARANRAEARSEATFNATQSGRPLSQTDYDKAKGELSQFTTLKTAFETFKDDYAGNFAGGLENTAQAYLDVGTPGQRDWWAQFKAADNQIRNDLFGSALTAPEKAAYEATTVSPGMDPKQVKINLAKRAEIVRKGVARRKEFYVANGFKGEAVDAIFNGVDLDSPITFDAAGNATKADENSPNGLPQGSFDGLPDDVNPEDVDFIERGQDGKISGYQLKDGSPFVALFDSGNARERDDMVKATADAQDLREGSAGFGAKADSGLLQGLSDETQGVGSAISSILRGENPVEGYKFGRDVARERYDRASENTGVLGDAVEIGSALALPIGTSTTVGRSALSGMAAGGLGGFGYGEGATGSALGSAVGVAAGGIIGGGGAKVSNVLANRAAVKAQQSAGRNALMGATEDLGMSKPARMFTEPSLQNRTRAVAGTIAGGSKVQQGVQAFGDEIEGALTSNLARGGKPLDNEVAGSVVRNAAERVIEKTGKSSARQYDQAEKLAGNAKVAPKEATQVLDSAIAELSETAGLNSAEITFLKTLKDDFSKDLSVGALRRARTTLRKKISKGELTFGESEGRVLSVMSAAAQDIESGLRAVGKGNAAAAFKAADTKYAARMEYINGTLQKIIGKRDANLSDEAVFRKFKSLATPGGNAAGLRKFYASLEKDEAADIAATFAERLGNGKAGFSTATLLQNISKLEESPSAITTIFGKDGAKAIDNLKMVATEHKRVSGSTAGQGSAQGNDWRWTLASMFIPAAGGGAAEGFGTAAVAGVTGLVIKAGRDAMSAKMLLSPQVTGWVRSAPKSASPKAIDAHFSKLGAIAKAQPALAADIDAFRSAVLQAANDNTNRAVAEDGEGEGVR